MNSGARSLLPWGLSLLSLLLLLWTRSQAQAAGQAVTARAIPVIRGAPITAAPEAGSDPAPAADVSTPEEAGLPEPGTELELERFAFDAYDPPELRGADSPALRLEDFPARVRVLHQARVSVVGFPLVASLDGDEVSQIMLSRFPPGCCFGSRPVLDEWILVDLEEPTSPANLYGRVVVTGVLDVGERIDASGYVESLYRLEAEELEQR